MVVLDLYNLERETENKDEQDNFQRKMDIYTTRYKILLEAW